MSLHTIIHKLLPIEDRLELLQNLNHHGCSFAVDYDYVECCKLFTDICMNESRKRLMLIV